MATKKKAANPVKNGKVVASPPKLIQPEKQGMTILFGDEVLFLSPDGATINAEPASDQDVAAILDAWSYNVNVVHVDSKEGGRILTADPMNNEVIFNGKKIPSRSPALLALALRRVFASGNPTGS